MGTAAHLSVRVPWHDNGWSGSACHDPLGNASCVLLKNVGSRRDDVYEIENAGRPFAELDSARLPCLFERATFMSPTAYTVERVHPYRFNKALSGALEPMPITVPAYGVHATPYFWLNRENVTGGVLDRVDVDYQPHREELVDGILGFSAPWVLHGDNQKALIERFFADVVPQSSLVFFYVKHSPFDGYGSGERLLVGAARVTSVTPPGRWRTNGQSPFPNHMWETSVLHSLRPDGRDGVLLPLARLAELDGEGIDVADALAWAPEQGHEFSYVTEHVSDDSAIEALERLLVAAQRCAELGADVAACSLEWISDRIGDLWRMRGPAPGLGSVLTTVGVKFGPVVAREIERRTSPDVDPWDTLVNLFEQGGQSEELTRFISETPRRVWKLLNDDQRAALKLLSRFQLTADQTRVMFTGKTEIEVQVADLVADPYYIYLCLLGGPFPTRFDVIDRGCFPDLAIRARFPLDESARMADGADGRRLQALIVDILQDAAAAGDTMLPLDLVVVVAGARRLAEPCQLDELTLRAHHLYPDSLPYENALWPPLVGARLADGRSAFKLATLATYGEVIRHWVGEQAKRPRHTVPGDLGAVLSRTLAGHVVAPEDQAAEDRAREEKHAALVELFASPLSVLNGRAGTGKTTLVRALVGHAEVNSKGVLLLAPTGKARVQLQQKVGKPAKTLAQFLSTLGRYDIKTGRYLLGEKAKAAMYGTVIVDECSMLTEEQLASLLDALRPTQRLVLVGDPRQLPPIGAGRPFVDLITKLIHGVDVPAFPRTAPGYAELTVLRRQAGRVREDLMLAGWFSGDEIPEGAEEVWENLRAGKAMDRLGAIRWDSPRPEGTVDRALAEELGVSGAEASARFELSYGAARNGQYLNFPKGDGGAGERCEEWQIISPTRGHAWGTVEINRHLKAKHRARTLDRALQNRNRTLAKPYGAEQIVLGDKVMNNRNNGRLKAYPPGSGLDYVANGEIGVVVGAYGKNLKALKWTKVEFSSQAGAEYSYLGGDEDPDLELAWAITIHKSQGSEFGKVFVVLPGSARQLSRELLYTALTRQQDRVILVHETIDELWDLTRSGRSETAKRLTDLFVAPDPREVKLPDGSSAGFLDANLVHIAADGTLVRSKNEVIVAGILEDLVPGEWAYESALTIGGLTRYPDFTSVTGDGRPFYWEHLGLLNSPERGSGNSRGIGKAASFPLMKAAARRES